MDTLKHLNAALGFIEEHITDEIDMGEVARMALCSPNVPDFKSEIWIPVKKKSA